MRNISRTRVAERNPVTEYGTWVDVYYVTKAYRDENFIKSEFTEEGMVEEPCPLI